MTCARPPTQWLYRADTFPETPALSDARHTLAELKSRPVDDMTDKDRADYIAAQADIHYHRASKLCTRDERLLLHQLATGRFANPANQQRVASKARGKDYARRSCSCSCSSSAG